MSHIEQQPGEHEGQPIEGAARNHRSPVAQAIHRMKARVKEHAARMSRLLGVGGGLCLLLLAAVRNLRHVWARADERWLRLRRERLTARLADWLREARVAVERWAQSHWDRLVNRYGKRRVQQMAIIVLLAVTVVCGPLSVLVVGSHIAQVSANGGQPNLIDPSAGANPLTRVAKASGPGVPKEPAFTPQKQRPAMAHGFAPTMQQGLLPLDPAKDAQFVGSDGQLEVDVPAGAVSSGDVTAAAGQQLALRVTEIAPSSGASAGGSGVVTLGSYLVEVVDGHGNRVGHGLRQATTLKLHVNSQASALDLRHAFIVLNGAHPKTMTGLGPTSTQLASYDQSQHLLTAAWPADPTVSGAGGPTSTPTASPTVAATTTATAKPQTSPTASPTSAATPAATPTTGASASIKGSTSAANPLSRRAPSCRRIRRVSRRRRCSSPGTPMRR